MRPPFADAWTADRLVGHEFPEPNWAIPGLVPEGLSVLAGAPKVGKSWLALGWALAVAGGFRALRSIECDPGPVLYLALEDNPRRLQNRILKVLDGDPAPAGARPAVHQAAEQPDPRPAGRAGQLARHAARGGGRLMETTFDVRISEELQVNKLAKGEQSYTVRWRVAKEPFSLTRPNKTLAKNERSKLVSAVGRGEAFYTGTGRLISEGRPRPN